MNLSLLLDMGVDGLGDRVLVGPRESGLTAARIRALSIGGAHAIRAAGADSLVYLGVNGPVFPISLFAAARAGVPLVPLNYRLAPDALEALLAHHPKALIVAGADQRALLPAGTSSDSTDEWLAVVEKLSEQDDEGAVETDCPAVLIYTSGTTSAPKGVLIHHDNLLAYVFDTVEFAGAADGDAALISVPPYHIAAVANVITNVYAGRRTIALDAFTAEGWLDTVRREQVTNALVVPTMLARIMSADDSHLDVPSLRTLAYGGAAMPVRVVERALRRWPHVDFVNAYGLTETSSTIAVLGPEDHRRAIDSADAAVRARLSSAGQVVSSVEMQIRAVDGSAMPAGIVGRIWVRGAQVSGEYAGGPATDEAGFFDTRDEGYFDEDGYLFIGGRADDTIIRGGENIAPAEIEDVLLALDDVVDAAIVGVPDDEWGQRIEGVVVLRPGANVDAEQLRAHVRARLRGSKTPDRIDVWDELPRTETGKLIRRDVVQLVQQRRH